MIINRDEIRKANRDQGFAKRLFRVVGPHAIAGKSTGETVELELTNDQADHLILAGHVTELGHWDLVGEKGPEILQSGGDRVTVANAPQTENKPAEKKPAIEGPSVPRKRRVTNDG